MRRRSLFETLCNPEFRHCETGCAVVPTITIHGDRFKDVRICERHRKQWAAEDAAKPARPEGELIVCGNCKEWTDSLDPCCPGYAPFDYEDAI